MCEMNIRTRGCFIKHLCTVHEIFSNILIAQTLSTTDRINKTENALVNLNRDYEQLFNNDLLNNI